MARLPRRAGGAALAALAAAALAVPGVFGALAPAAPTKAQNQASGLPWPPLDYNTGLMTPDLVVASTNGGCDFIDGGAWEDQFSTPSLNLTRWLSDSTSGQDHCVGLPPAGPSTCTQMLPSQLQLGVPLPGYPGGANGLIMSLSQGPCNNANQQCCNNNGICANWAGAHLVSAGCVQFGVIELEAAFNMPPSSGGFYFTALYIVKGFPDPAWNEIDIGMINGPRGLEFHTTVFTAPSTGTGTTTTMDALIFDATGPVQSMGGPPKGSDGSSQDGKTNPNAKFSNAFAANYHTYKVVWTPTWKAWMVDTMVYRNITFTTWRPQSIRQILRTNIGTDGDVTPLPDANVYIRRIRYTPLSDQAVADAKRCVSMAACYGDMPVPKPGFAMGALGVSPGGGPGGRRRSLLSLSDDNQREALADAIAASVPGISADSVTVTVTGYAVTGVVAVEDPAGVLDITTFTPDMQAAFVGGIAVDVQPGAQNVYITSVTDISDYTGDLSLATSRGVNGGVVVAFTVAGYDTEHEAQTDLEELNAADGLQACTDRLSAADTLHDFAAILARSDAPVDPLAASLSTFGFSVLGASPTLSLLSSDSHATMAVRIAVDPSSQHMVENAFNNALHSGAFGRALEGSSGLGLTVIPPSATQSMALARANTICEASLDAEVAEERKWRDVGIAFIIIAGTSLINCAAFVVYHRRTMASMQSGHNMPPASYVADVVAALAARQQLPGVGKSAEWSAAAVAGAPEAAQPASPTSRGAALVAEHGEEQA